MLFLRGTYPVSALSHRLPIKRLQTNEWWCEHSTVSTWNPEIHTVCLKMTDRMDTDKSSSAPGTVNDWLTWILWWFPLDGRRCHLSLMECHMYASLKEKCSFGCCCSQFPPHLTTIKNERSQQKGCFYLGVERGGILLIYFLLSWLEQPELVEMLVEVRGWTWLLRSARCSGL